MRKAPLTYLLPWLSGEPLSDAKTRRGLRDFLRSFDGSPAAGHVRVYAAAGEAELLGGPKIPDRVAKQTGYEPIPKASAKALARLRTRVLEVINKGFPYEKGRTEPMGDRVMALPSLRIGVRRRAPEAAQLTAADRKRYQSQPGSYEVFVDGDLKDIIPYLVARQLTQPGGASLARCAAPAPGSGGKQSCGRLFLVTTGKGRPRRWCSEACRVRDHTYRTEGTQEQARRS